MKRNDFAEKHPALTFAIALALIPIAVFANAFVIVNLWRWFAVTTFHVDEIGMRAAMGLSLLAARFTATTTVKDPDPSLGKAIGTVIIGPLFVLGFGWFLSH